MGVESITNEIVKVHINGHKSELKNQKHKKLVPPALNRVIYPAAGK
ncbi:hypothetical protein CRD_02036 [Raphidiopsis brookii D9]|nr:hypothetical protein CRD_02036 [Raphidiopsis brookii D9]